MEQKPENKSTMASICVEESSKGSVGELKVMTTFSFAGVKLTEGKFQVNEAADTAKVRFSLH